MRLPAGRRGGAPTVTRVGRPMLDTAPPEFFARVLATARRAGALSVLDEVVTFRLAPGGAQQLLGLSPDLTTFGKLIGGGFPIGAIGGARDLLATTDASTG